MSWLAFPRRWLFALAPIIGAAASLLALRAWEIVHPRVLAEAAADVGCDLHGGPCRARFPDGASVTLAIAPRPIRPATPLDVEVRVTALDADGAEVDFTSPDMNLGFNRATLAAAAGGSFGGRARLPVCTFDRMRWRANVLLHTPRGHVSAVFTFDTTRTP
jgi:hypothetical protein